MVDVVPSIPLSRDYVLFEVRTETFVGLLILKCISALTVSSVKKKQKELNIKEYLAQTFYGRNHLLNYFVFI